MRLGATGVQEDNPPGFVPKYRQPWDTGPAPQRPRTVLLRAWFSERVPSEKLALLRSMALEEPAWEEQVAEDWEENWKKHFDTLHISERLIITPPWKPIEGAVVIEPGNAFGTGDHPTTRACLEAIARFETSRTCLDIGCGSGILALAAARLGMEAIGIDIDPDAVRSAQGAAEANHLSVAFSTTPLENIEGTYDLVVANLYAEVLAALSPHILRVAGWQPDTPMTGILVFAGILADRAYLVRNAFGVLPPPEEKLEGDWVSMVYRG